MTTFPRTGPAQADSITDRESTREATGRRGVGSSYLPADVARCNGYGNDAQGWREGCETCLRRISPRPDRCVIISPPPIIAFECEFMIEAMA